MLFHHLSDPSTDVDLEQVVCTLREAVDVEAMTEAWRLVAERHPCLRTEFRWRDVEEPVQQVAPRARVQPVLHDFGGLPPAQRAGAVEAHLAADRAAGFDLDRPPLTRLALLRSDERDWTLVWTFHHIVLDGRSQIRILTEVLRSYDALAAGEAVTLGEPPPHVPYPPWLDELDPEESRAFWTRKLKGIAAPTPLVVDRPTGGAGRGERETRLSPENLSALQELAGEIDVTLNTLFQGAWALLLHRYSRSRDVVFGAVRAGRGGSEAARSMVGMFINTLPVRVSVSPEAPIVPWLQSLRAEQVALRPFEGASLAQIRKWSELGAGDRFFDSILVFDHESLNFALRSLGGPFRNREFRLIENTGYPLCLYAYAQPDLTLKLNYERSRFDDATIERILGHLKTLLEGMAEDPRRRLADLPILTNAERRQLLDSWNATTVSYDRARCVHEAFSEQAVTAPRDVALVFRDQELTYAQLDELSNRAAHRLRGLGVGPGERVGIYMRRSTEMVVGLLGILKAGAAYVPLDPTYPAARLALMVEDAGLKLVLTQSSLEAGLGAWSVEVVALDPGFEQLRDESAEPCDAGVSGEDLAYVIYTSGSTGKPKGVQVHHRNVANFFTAMDARVDRGARPVFLALTSISFDISVLELFWTLARGFKVVVQADEDLAHAAESSGGGARRNVDFSLFYFASDAGRDTGDRYELLMEGARFADTRGFRAVWTPERHFHAFGGLYPNPAVVSAAVAAVTERVRIRAGSVVLPLHDPIRVAEEWAVVDNLSRGRVDISFASGWQTNDFVLAPASYDGRKELTFAGIETVRRLWRGETVLREGVGGAPVPVSTLPRPVQGELQCWVTAGGSPETFTTAGKLGANVLTHLLGQSIEQLAEKIRLYRESWRAAGHRGKGCVTLMLHTFVGSDLDTVRETVRQPFSDYLRTALDLVKIAPHAFPNFSLENRSGTKAADRLSADDFTEDTMAALVDHAFERYFETSGLFGTPTSCLAMIERLGQIEVDEVACLIDFGVEPGAVLASLEHLDELRRNATAATKKAAGYSLPEQFRRHEVTHLQCTPSMAKALMLDPESRRCLGALRVLLVGGEALPASLAAELRRNATGQLLNMYGPTETTVWSTTHAVREDDPPLVIGRPVANTQVYIADELLCPVPVGIPGELLIGGDGVTAGYLHEPGLTAQKFIPSPFGSEATLYRTGDEARYLPNGEIQFLGRLDHQVKIRGHRIELAEIETALEGLPGIREAVVVANRDGGGDQRLVAYFTAAGRAPPVDELRASLRRVLPEFMLPSVFVALDSLPLTPNGKIDRAALPAPEPGRPELGAPYVAPRNATEQAIARIWNRLLRVERVGVHDNFFDLGGDSILAVQIVAQANQAGLRLTVRQLLDHQTVAELAPVTGSSVVAAAEQGPVTGPVRLTPIQRWLLEQDLPALHHYNQTMLLTVPPDVDSELLREAVAAVVAHHDALRMRFARRGGAHEQWNAGVPSDVPFARVGLAHFTAREVPAGLAAVVNEAQASLNLEKGPVFRVVHVDVGAGMPDRLLLIGHHLVVDGVSWRILLEDLQTAYRQRAQRRPIRLPAKTTSFQAWAERLFERAQAARGLGVDYWRSLAALAELPVDFAGGANVESSARTVTVALSAQETAELLHRVPRAYNTRINDALLAALAQVLAHWQRRTTVRLDLEGHGREDVVERVDLSRTVGWFTSLFPVELELPSDDSPGEVLKAVKEQLRAVPANGVGFGMLRYLSAEWSGALAALPPAGIQFNYLGQFAQMFGSDSMFAAAPEPPGAFARVASPEQPRPYLLEVLGMVVDDGLEMSWHYSENVHDRSTVQRLADEFMARLRAIITHCTARETRELTPADFPLANLDQAKLEKLATSRPAGTMENVEDVYALSSIQRGMVLHCMASPASAEIYVSQLTGVLAQARIEAFEQAWRDVVARHPMLRTAFLWEELDEPLQLVECNVELPIERVDLTQVAEHEQSARIRERLDRERACGIPLSRPPLARLTLLKTREDTYRFIFTFHALVLDGWSKGVVLKDLLDRYESHKAGRATPPGKGESFRRYVAWLQRQDVSVSEPFWRARLAGFVEPTPIGRRRGKAGARSYADRSVELSAEMTGRLTDFARDRRITVGTIMQGMWALLLARHSGESDVVFGCDVSGRPTDLVGSEEIVGFTVNTIPVRVAVQEGAMTMAWLARLQEQQNELRSHENVPLDRIRGWSAVPARAALFDSVVLLENWPSVDVLSRFHELEFCPLVRTMYALTLCVLPRASRLTLHVAYDRSRFDEASIDRFLAFIQSALTNLVANPDLELSELSGTSGDASIPPAQPARLEAGGELVAPRTETEARIERLCATLLDRREVGVEENLLEAGVHSLFAAQLLAEVQHRFGVTVPFAAFFVNPTVAGLAAALADAGGGAERDDCAAAPARMKEPANIEAIGRIRVQALTRAEAEVLQQEYARRGERGRLHDLNLSRTSRAARDEVTNLLACDGDRPVGKIALCPCTLQLAGRELGFIASGNLFVDPAYRARGVASQLITEVLELGRDWIFGDISPELQDSLEGWHRFRWLDRSPIHHLALSPRGALKTLGLYAWTRVARSSASADLPGSGAALTSLWSGRRSGGRDLPRPLSGREAMQALRQIQTCDVKPCLVPHDPDLLARAIAGREEAMEAAVVRLGERSYLVTLYAATEPFQPIGHGRFDRPISVWIVNEIFPPPEDVESATVLLQLAVRRALARKADVLKICGLSETIAAAARSLQALPLSRKSIVAAFTPETLAAVPEARDPRNWWCRAWDEVQLAETVPPERASRPQISDPDYPRRRLSGAGND